MISIISIYAICHHGSWILSIEKGVAGGRSRTDNNMYCSLCAYKKRQYRVVMHICLFQRNVNGSKIIVGISLSNVS